MFAAVRDALLQTYGDTGNITTFVTDFESASINAIQQVFPSATLKGCSFHFRQALMRRIQRDGLRSAYETDEAPEVRQWLRRIMAMTLLPAFAIPLIWQVLQHPPVTGNLVLDAKTGTFATYVDGTWINGSFPPSLWSHFDNLGPRTTNLAEGWHNGLNTLLGVSHPSTRTFLDWLQRYQFEIQSRCLQLAAGRPPKERRPAYVQVEKNIADAKLQYGLQIGQLFCYQFPSPYAMEQLWALSCAYLDRVSYLVIGA